RSQVNEPGVDGVSPGVGGVLWGTPGAGRPPGAPERSRFGRPRLRVALFSMGDTAPRPEGRFFFVSLIANLYRRFEHLVRELAKFGSVGAMAFVITIGTANALQFGLHLGPLKSNAVATVVATTF